MEPIYIILLCVVAFVAVLHVLSSRRTPKLRTINARSGAVDRNQASRQADPLIAACLGDRSKADRLALYEKKKAPFITDAEARRRAGEADSRSTVAS